MEVFLKTVFVVVLFSWALAGGYAKVVVPRNEGHMAEKLVDLPEKVWDQENYDPKYNMPEDVLDQRNGNRALDLGRVEYGKQTPAMFLSRDMALGDVLPQQALVTNCVSLIAQSGVKRAFSKCKTHLQEAVKFCKSTAAKKSHKTVCEKMLVGVSITVDECEVQAKKFKKPSELCAAIVPKKKSKADCKAGQLFAQLPGGSSEPVCIDAPLNKRSNTQPLPLRLYQHWPEETNSNLATEQQGGIDVVVHTIPIGQGDCNVITCNSGKNAIIFDCGSSAGNIFKDPTHSNFIMKYFTKAENVTVLVSHGHNDHFSYIGNILDYLATKGTKPSIQVLLGGPITDYNANFRKKLDDVSATPVTTPYNFCDNTNIRFEFLFSDSKYDNPNQRGMLMKLSCSTCKSDLLFTGDMEGPAADTFAATHATFLKSTHYKMAHHGASTHANKMPWLKAISPVEVHVSHVFNGRYKHPRCEAIRLILGLNTVGTTTTPKHTFTCFEDDKTEKSDQIQHRLYSTAPADGILCLIEMTFSANSEANTAYYCDPPSNFV